MTVLKCRVVSAHQELYAGEVKMVIASGQEGDLGILAGHIPIITLLKPGVLRLQLLDGSEEVLYVSGGVLEVQPKQVLVLADAAERARDLDEAKIQEARRHAEQILVNQKDTLQTNAAMAALAESVAQLQTIQKYKNRA